MSTSSGLTVLQVAAAMADTQAFEQRAFRAQRAALHRPAEERAGYESRIAACLALAEDRKDVLRGFLVEHGTEPASVIRAR